jgi:hypothetical protein
MQGRPYNGSYAVHEKLVSLSRERLQSEDREKLRGWEKERTTGSGIRGRSRR